MEKALPGVGMPHLARQVAPSSFGEPLSIKSKLNICLLEGVYYCDNGVANSGSFPLII